MLMILSEISLKNTLPSITIDTSRPVIDLVSISSVPTTDRLKVGEIIEFEFLLEASLLTFIQLRGRLIRALLNLF